MQITIITVGSRGDVQPYVALGIGLQRAGHGVRLATHAEFETLVAERGLTFCPVAGDPRTLMERHGSTRSSGSSPMRFFRQFAEVARQIIAEMVQDCWRAAAGSDALIVSAPGCFVGYHIAQKLRIPLIPAYVQPFTRTRAFPNPFFPPGLSAGWYNRLTYPAFEGIAWALTGRIIDRVRREVLDLPPLGLPGPFPDLHRPSHPHLYGFSPSVVPRPSDWPDWHHTTGYWFLDRPAEWRPPAALTDFLVSGPAPVYVGFGSMADRSPEETLRTVLAALRRSGQRGILVAGWGGLGSAHLPDEVLALESVPHDWLFPRCAAVVHHGGAGTTAAGLRAGVPSITVPFFADQPFWAQRVRALDAGPRPIPRRALTTERLAAAIRLSVGTARLHARAHVLGVRIHEEDGVGSATNLIERHVAAH